MLVVNYSIVVTSKFICWIPYPLEHPHPHTIYHKLSRARLLQVPTFNNSDYTHGKITQF